MVKKILLFAALALTLCSCDKYYFGSFFVPEEKTVNKRFEESVKLNEERGEISLYTPDNDYKIYVAADVHVETSANNLEKFLKIEDSKRLCSFVLGDFVTKKGTMPIVKDIIKDYTVFTTVGNHDLYFNQWEDYRELFGSATYYLTVETPTAQDLYIFLDSASGTFGKGQMNWLKKLLKDKRKDYRHCIISTHTNFFRSYIPLMLSGNYQLDETLEFTNLCSEYNIDLVLQAHHHKREFVSFDGVDYVLVETIKDKEDQAGYLIVEISERVECKFEKI